MKEKDGNITTDREEILNICAEFYQELYSTQKGGNKTYNIQNMKSTDDTEVPDITEIEVELAVNQIKDYNVPGTDDITSDMFKIGGEEINKHLVKLYNQILHDKQILKKWKEAKIILLHKNGDKADIKNYRPISLLSHAYKIFIRILQNRIQRILDENQPREQAGFRG